MGKDIYLSDFTDELCIHDENKEHLAAAREDNERLPDTAKRVVEELLRYLFILAKKSKPEDDTDEDESTPAPLKLNPFFRL